MKHNSLKYVSLLWKFRDPVQWSVSKQLCALSCCNLGDNVTNLPVCRYRWDEDGLFRLQTVNTDTTKVTENVVELEDSQPLCGSSNGQSSDGEDPLALEAAEGEIVISVM
jgi:hypothetical protein